MAYKEGDSSFNLRWEKNSLGTYVWIWHAYTDRVTSCRQDKQTAQYNICLFTGGITQQEYRRVQEQLYTNGVNVSGGDIKLPSCASRLSLAGVTAAMGSVTSASM